MPAPKELSAPCCMWKLPLAQPNQFQTGFCLVSISALQLPPAKIRAELLGRRWGGQHSCAFNKCWLLQEPEMKIPLSAVSIPQYSPRYTSLRTWLMFSLLFFSGFFFFSVSHFCFLLFSLSFCALKSSSSSSCASASISFGEGMIEAQVHLLNLFNKLLFG